MNGDDVRKTFEVLQKAFGDRRYPDPKTYPFRMRVFVNGHHVAIEAFTGFISDCCDRDVAAIMGEMAVLTIYQYFAEGRIKVSSVKLQVRRPTSNDWETVMYA